MKATNVAAAAGSLSNAGVGNLTSINTTGLNAGNAASVIGSVNVAGVNTTALTNLMSCMQTRKFLLQELIYIELFREPINLGFLLEKIIGAILLTPETLIGHKNIFQR